MKENTDAKLNAKQKKFVSSVASGDFATDAYIAHAICRSSSLIQKTFARSDAS